MPTAMPRRRARHRLSGAVLVALSATLVFSAPTLAQDDFDDRIEEVEEDQQRTGQQKRDTDARADRLDADLADTSTELVEADARLRRTNQAVTTATENLQAAEAELADAQGEEERIDAELQVAYANEERLEESLQQTKRDQKESEQAVGAIARESYKNGGVGNLAMTLDVLSGEDDAMEDMAMARTVMRVQDNTIDRLNTQRAQEVAEQDRLEGVRQDITMLLAEAEANVLRKQQARNAADESKRELEEVEARQREDRVALESEKATFEKQLSQAESDSDALESELAELAQKKHGLEVEQQAERQRIAQEKARKRAEAEERARREAAAQAAAEAEAEREAQARAEAEAASSEQETASSAPAPAPEPAAPEPPPAPPSSGYLSAPSPAGVTSSFGYRTHPILGTSRLHAGIDYGGGCGSPVHAPADGTVVAATSTSGGGNKLIVDHGVQRGVNLTTTYAHLQSYAVTGGSVSRGQVIAYVGNTGLSTACHLHFETRENGIAVDPWGWL